MAITVLDANLVIAMLDPTHVLHDAAEELLKSIIADELKINDFTLAEILAGAVGTGQETDLLEAIQTDIGARSVGFTGTEWSVTLAQTRANSSPRLKMPDAIVLATPKKLDGLVGTLDNRLSRAAEREGRLRKGD